MPPQLLGLVISAIGCFAVVTAAVGIPALAVVCSRYLKLKERELMLEMEYRQRSQQQDFALESRLRRVEAVLNLDPAEPAPELLRGVSASAD
jgi:hypothetical protein